MVELLGHLQLVVDREREPLLLRPVAKGGVEDVDGIRQGREVEVMAGATGTVPRAVATVILAVGTGVRDGLAYPCVGVLTGSQRVVVLLGGHSTWSSQSLYWSTSPRTVSKNTCCSFWVIGPGFPEPTSRSSTERIGTTSAAVPVRNASSAV